MKEPQLSQWVYIAVTSLFGLVTWGYKDFKKETTDELKKKVSKDDMKLYLNPLEQRLDAQSKQLEHITDLIESRFTELFKRSIS